jgi:hypothetical protein
MYPVIIYYVKHAYYDQLLVSTYLCNVLQYSTNYSEFSTRTIIYMRCACSNLNTATLYHPMLMQESVRAQYPYVTFVDTLITCLTVKQLENESLTDYSKRFKQHKGILKQMLGTEFMDYWVGNQPAYKKLTGSNAETMAKRGKIKD